MDLTIVVVTFNSERFVRKCLDSLVQYAPKRYTVDIVVVDNASSDETVAIIKAEYPQIRLIESSENLGFGRGNNLGMLNAPARYYYLHNADAYLQANVLDQALDILETAPQVGVAGLPLVFPDLSPQTGAYSFTTPAKWLLQGLGFPTLIRNFITNERFRWLRGPLSLLPMGRSFISTHSSENGSPDHTTTVDWVCGAALILREEVRIALGGGFDPTIFLYGEDEDLCIEARKCGWSIVQLPTTPVIHEFGWGMSGKTSPVVAKLKADSLKVFINKHFRRRSASWAVMRILLWVKRRSWGVR